MQWVRNGSLLGYRGWYFLPNGGQVRFSPTMKEVLAIRRICSLVDMITNTKFSNCPNVFKIGVVWQ